MEKILFAGAVTSAVMNCSGILAAIREFMSGRL
jgi:hypothetical protein